MHIYHPVPRDAQLLVQNHTLKISGPYSPLLLSLGFDQLEID